jgi:leader peptidase (prepilin peptidase) / N-methyltransferase
MILVTALFAGLFGTAIGSFLNVCVHRLPRGESVVTPRSRCPGCGHAIGWQDNIPVLSYLLLRGKCRGCGTRISVRYPLVELASGALWLAAVLVWGAEWQALVMAVFFTLLLGIALTDLSHYIIPDAFSIGGLVIGLALAFLPGGLTIVQAAIGAVVGFGLLFLVAWVGEWIFRKPAMGGGDIKMMAMVGAFLGPIGVVLTIFLGALLGSLIFGPISLKTGKLVPFGIFLALGALVTAVWGEPMIDWYVRSFFPA